MSDNLAGRRLGQYVLQERIAEGGMATIYRAKASGGGPEVAVKVMAARLAAYPQFAQRFQAETRALTALQHPHILPVYEAGHDGGHPYLVTAYLPGGTLAGRIAAHPNGLPLRDALKWAGQLASALDYAHKQGVIHRDVKPGNVLLDGQDNALLADFGLAEWTGGSDNGQSGPLPGTYAYMAPELAFEQPITPACDIYALGVVIYEMLAGCRPFELLARDQFEAFWKKSTAVPDLRRIRSDVPVGVRVVIEQALNRDPAGRPPHAAALAHALARAAGARSESLSLDEALDRLIEQDKPADSTPASPTRPATTLDDAPDPDTDPAPAAPKRVAAALDALIEEDTDVTPVAGTASGYRAEPVPLPLPPPPGRAPDLIIHLPPDQPYPPPPIPVSAPPTDAPARTVADMPLPPGWRQSPDEDEFERRAPAGGVSYALLIGLVIFGLLAMIAGIAAAVMVIWGG